MSKPRFNKKEAETAVGLLERAHRIISKNEGQFICPTLTPSETWSLHSRLVASDLRAWINSMLEHYGSLDAWVIVKGHTTIDRRNRNPKHFYKKLKATRLAWIEWMISELEPKPATKKEDHAAQQQPIQFPKPHLKRGG